MVTLIAVTYFYKSKTLKIKKIRRIARTTVCYREREVSLLVNLNKRITEELER